MQKRRPTKALLLSAPGGLNCLKLNGLLSTTVGHNLGRRTMIQKKGFLKTILSPAISSLDSWSFRPSTLEQRLTMEDWVRCVPYIGIHLGCFLVIWFGWSPVAVGVAVFLYLIRMFAITAFYHRYFSHRAFSAPRWLQFLFAVIGNTSMQRGPLWWSAHHRHHHAFSDTKEDIHSPVVEGRFFWSHTAWFMAGVNYPTQVKYVKDWLKFPELVFIDRFDTLIPIAMGFGLYYFGEALPAELGTSGWQMMTWGFFISTVVLYHGTFMINSLAHVAGTRRFPTPDHSRNNWFLALVTLGEGWHNNHHFFPGAARQGIKWWEVDITFYVLKMMETLGLVWALKEIPKDQA
jgi:stearoyl-CoA desaturase (Delta-9 desaturase)